jgi:hypothetical protein
VPAHWTHPESARLGWIDEKGGVEIARLDPKGGLQLSWIDPEGGVLLWWSFTKENPLRLAVEASGDFTVPDAVVAMVLDVDPYGEKHPFFIATYPKVDSLIIITEGVSPVDNSRTRVVTEMSLYAAHAQAEVDEVAQSIFNEMAHRFMLKGSSTLLITETGHGDLILSGEVKDGVYEDGLVDFGSTLGFDSPFTYKKGKVLATLNSGSVEVEVKSNELKKISGPLSFTIETDIESEVTSTLKLNGKVDGQYVTGSGFDLTGSLTLVPPFQYKKGKLTVDLLSGQFGVEVKASQLEALDGQGLETLVTATVQGMELPLLGITDAGYDKTNGISGDASLKLQKGCTIQLGKKAVYLEKGTPFKLLIKKGLIKWVKSSGIKITPDDDDG